MEIMESTSAAHVPQTTQPEEFDLVILGTGTGSTIAAWRFAGEGKRVAAVERRYIGGSCPNIACLPSKNIIHSAKVASYFRQSKEFGITHDGFTIEMSGVSRSQAQDGVQPERRVPGELQEHRSRVHIGNGTVCSSKNSGSHSGRWDTRKLRGANVIVSTGTRAALDAIPGLADAKPLTHIEALELDEIPEHLLVIGGGYVGVELSQAMRRFGSKVMVIGRNGRLMSKEDPTCAMLFAVCSQMKASTFS